LSDQPSAILIRTAVAPAEQAAQHNANKRSYEPVSAFVTSDHSYRFLLSEKAMGRNEVSRTDGHLRAWRYLNVAQPISIWTETAHHHNFRTLLPVLHDFQDRLTTQASTTADVRQE
jgi:hypothetical protein